MKDLWIIIKIFIGLFAILFLYAFFRVFSNPLDFFTTPFEDKCNELRSRQNCNETEKYFVCKENNKTNTFNKSICFNTGDGNTNYRFLTYKSPLIGQTFQSRVHALYLKNLFRNNCPIDLCGKRRDIELQDIRRNKCPGTCLPDNRKDQYPKIRVQMVNPGMKFKVIDSFKSRRKKLLRGYDHEYLIVEDEQGTQSEVFWLSFKSIAEPLEINSNSKRQFSTEMQPDSKIWLEDLDHLRSKGSITKLVCFKPFSEISVSKLDSDVNQFIEKLSLKNEVSISQQTKNLAIKKKWSEEREDHLCISLTYGSEEGYLTTTYFLGSFINYGYPTCLVDCQL